MLICYQIEFRHQAKTRNESSKVIRDRSIASVSLEVLNEIKNDGFHEQFSTSETIHTDK